MADTSRTADERHKLNRQIGARCKQARIAQEKLAEKLNVSAQYLSDMERGVVGLSLLTLTDLSNQLSVTTDFLLKDETPGGSPRQIQVGARTIPLTDQEYEILEDIINSTIQAFHVNDEAKNTSENDSLLPTSATR
jgi:transcriptional regulator with XRE-family HTH domain